MGRLLKGLEGVGLADLEGRSGFHKNYTELGDDLTRPAPLRGAADLNAPRIPPGQTCNAGKLVPGGLENCPLGTQKMGPGTPKLEAK